MLPGDMTPVLQIFCGANGTQINLFDFDSFHNFFLGMKLEKNVFMWLFYYLLLAKLVELLLFKYTSTSCIAKHENIQGTLENI